MKFQNTEDTIYTKIYVKRKFGSTPLHHLTYVARRQRQQTAERGS